MIESEIVKLAGEIIADRVEAEASREPHNHTAKPGAQTVAPLRRAAEAIKDFEDNGCPPSCDGSCGGSEYKAKVAITAALDRDEIAKAIHRAMCEQGWDDCQEEERTCFRGARAVIAHQLGGTE